VTIRPAAVILAAGRGTRIGTPKHRLTAGDRTFLEKVLGLARDGGCSPVVCVVAEEEADRIRAGNGDAVRVIVNPDPGRGMLSSLQEGLAVLDSVSGVFVFPVDHPYIDPATMRLMVACVEGQQGAVVKPEYLGRGGHPVYIPAALIGRIMTAAVGRSLREIIAESHLPVVRVPVNDAGVVRNVNTPGDL
jgi:molybdenum cofactor cytidylyltransferase